jgi:hypothetical protein
MFKLKQFLAVMLAFALVATGMAAVSADVDNVYSIFWGADGVKMVPWYNHDYSVLKGPGYYEEVSKLLAAGYIPRSGYAISEYSGGTGQQYGSYDEDYFVSTQLSIMMEGGIGVIFRTTPEGLQYSEDGITFLPVPATMEVPVEVEELLLQEQFDHDAWGLYREGRRWYIGWHDTGSDTNEPFLTVINDDGTQAVWTIMDVYGTSMAMVVITGEEEWDTRTIIYELPQAGAGSPQLLPKNYGLVLNQPYNKYGLESIAEIPEEFSKYYKIDGDKIITYTNSPLDVWFFKNVWKVNHNAYLEDLEEDAHNKWLAARVK